MVWFGEIKTKNYQNT